MADPARSMAQAEIMKVERILVMFWILLTTGVFGSKGIAWTSAAVVSARGCLVIDKMENRRMAD